MKIKGSRAQKPSHQKERFVSTPKNDPRPQQKYSQKQKKHETPLKYNQKHKELEALTPPILLEMS